VNSNLSTVVNSLRGMLSKFLAALPYIVIALLVYAVFHTVAKMIRRTIMRLAIRRKQHSAGLVVGRLAEGGVMLLGALVALMIAVPSFNPAQLVELLGIGGVAVGFAFRDILQNFLAGILILLTEPFRINDQIVVGPFEGTVEDIETRATMIRTGDGRRVVIPNSKVFTDAVIVNTAFDRRRLEYDVSIGNRDDIALAKELLLRAVHRAAEPLEFPAPETLVVELAPSAVVVRVRWWISLARRENVVESMDRALQAINAELLAHGIDQPFPTTQVLFHDQTEETDGDRRLQREGWPAGNEPVPRSRFQVLQATKQASNMGKARAAADGEDSI
jgi:small conductance mechanosensitive channel